MCNCRASKACALQMREIERRPGEPWSMVCSVTIGTTPSGLPRRCGAETQGGYGGLHSHHLTAHPTSLWIELPGHP